MTQYLEYHVVWASPRCFVHTKQKQIKCLAFSQTARSCKVAGLLLTVQQPPTFDFRSRAHGTSSEAGTDLHGSLRLIYVYGLVQPI